MHLFAAIPLALLAPASGAPAGIPSGGEIRLSAPDRCDPIRNVRRTDAPGTATAQRLIDLPPGNLDLSVMRRIGDCPEPVTIREGYGAFGGSRGVKPGRPPARPRARLLGR
jgi:hypothetical protein